VGKSNKVGFHNGGCGGEVRESSGGKSFGVMGAVNVKGIMVCLKCDRVVPDSELLKEAPKEK